MDVSIDYAGADGWTVWAVDEDGHTGEYYLGTVSDQWLTTWEIARAIEVELDIDSPNII